MVEALDPASGKTQWRSAYPTAYRDDFGFDEGPRAAPAMSGGRIFTYGAEGVLTAWDAAAGKRVWQRKAMVDYRAPKGFFGAACSPVVAGDRVLVAVGGTEQGGVVAFDTATGKSLWAALQEEAGYSSPVLAPLRGKQRAVFFTREGLAVLDPATGAVEARMQWKSRSRASVNAATPVVQENQIFLTSSYGTGAVLVDLANGSPKTVWSGDDSLSAHYATPVLHDGHLYGYHGRQEMGAELRCVTWQNGKVRWAESGFGAGSVLLAGRRLLLVRENGEAVSADASPAGFRALARHRVSDSPVRAYPAIAGGRLFVRNERGRLSAFAPPANPRG